jgi:hypothetical protein
MNYAKFPDQYISSYITSLNIRLPERVKEKSSSKENEELKKINELLSKNKTFDTGIQYLKKYIQVHPEFSPIEYFTSLNYDQKFIHMVVNTLEGNNKARRTPGKDGRGEEASQNAKNN